ncbi:MAG: hypothetical protein M5R40_19500 [Anaerolineae bacterium]|nr:hypothetical protein [Anaerolineae bacterium]
MGANAGPRLDRLRRGVAFAAHDRAGMRFRQRWRRLGAALDRRVRRQVQQRQQVGLWPARRGCASVRRVPGFLRRRAAHFGGPVRLPLDRRRAWRRRLWRCPTSLAGRPGQGCARCRWGGVLRRMIRPCCFRGVAAHCGRAIWRAIRRVIRRFVRRFDPARLDQRGEEVRSGFDLHRFGCVRRGGRRLWRRARRLRRLGRQPGVCARRPLLSGPARLRRPRRLRLRSARRRGPVIRSGRLRQWRARLQRARCDAIRRVRPHREGFAGLWRGRFVRFRPGRLRRNRQLCSRLWH